MINIGQKIYTKIHIKYTGEIHMSFANLKNRRQDLSKLVEAAQETQNKSRAGDPRFWTPTRDKAGNGFAVIRFLPGLDPDSTPWVKYWEHMFKGPTGQWYNEKSLTTFKEQDPVSEMNSKLWNEDGSNQAKAIARERKRLLRHVSNILVISDPSNPENEGKVFLYRYGKKVMDKVMDKMQPQFPDEQPLNPFDLWEGADFVIKIRTVDGYPNYDASSFKEQSSLFNGDDEMLEKLYNQQHDMSEWSNRDNYKSYEDLKDRLMTVLGEKTPKAEKSFAQSVQNEVSLEKDEALDMSHVMDAPIPSQNTESEPDIPTAESSMEEEDDIMAKFAALAKD
jgi:hypothetical protein